jgi:nucleoside-diphosphate-sugar epimerase
MNPTDRILILGCSGTVGSRLVEKLCMQGLLVFGVRGQSPCPVVNDLHHCVNSDLLTQDVSEYVRYTKTFLLIHTAWEMTPTTFWNDSNNFKWSSKSALLIQKFFEYGGGKVLVTGSCAEYSWVSDSTLSEKSIEGPNSAYGESKLNLLRFIQDEGFPYLWTRTFFQFGQDKHSNKLIPKLIRSAIAGTLVNLENPLHVRDFIHIDDIIPILSALIVGNQSGIVNIASGIGRSVSDVVQQVEMGLGKKIDIVYADSGGSPTSVVADVSRLRSLLRNFEIQPFAESIECTIREYLRPI